MHCRIIGFTIAATVFYLFGNGVSAQEVVCQRPDRETCVKPVEERLPSNFHIFPSASELKQYCEPLLFVVRCTIGSNNTCPITREEFRPIRELEELAPLLEDICNENSSMGEAYREKIDCISVIEDSIEDIISNFPSQFRESVEDVIYDVPGRLSEKHWRAIRCTSNKYRLRQILAFTDIWCGNETTTFMTEYFFRVLTPYEVLCPDDDEEIQGFVSLLEQRL